MQKTIEKIEKEKIIVIVRGVAREKLLPLAQAMYDGGIRLIECTYDASGRVSDEETAANIEMLAKRFDSKMLVGAGTVLTEKQVELTKNAGGKFIISPDTNTDIIAKTKELGLVSIPGALTPSEITAASRAGADFVKVFPVNFFGVEYIKAVTAPISNVRLLAVGGINEKNMGQYFAAGVCGIGVATGILNRKMIEENDFEGITKLAKAYTDNCN
ncbi:MAG: bifunctional 4-hydroxy-2-oxoglutarate aldolase/2-dehydro-3-deoxy-phosphogluconate aldolase [Clostridia bacterium]|nr:bifunctional 4-hydroxy-2-oxoglutarate aldolase/2-dehydro-3-deoxy-phosphogluconate aldolase [Clostridia bacterium]